jgi:hypothetical protein
MTDSITIPVDLLRELHDHLVESIDQIGPCDHEVGLCICDLKQLEISTGRQLNKARTADINECDFIEIPTWKTTGLVVSVKPAMTGNDSAVEVVLETEPDDPSPRTFTLEDGQFNFV